MVLPFVRDGSSVNGWWVLQFGILFNWCTGTSAMDMYVQIITNLFYIYIYVHINMCFIFWGVDCHCNGNHFLHWILLPSQVLSSAEGGDSDIVRERWGSWGDGAIEIKMPLLFSCRFMRYVPELDISSCHIFQMFWIILENTRFKSLQRFRVPKRP